MGCGLLAGALSAGVSHRGEMQKAGARCEDCHSATAASTASKGKRNLRFNHKLHLGMGNVAPLLRDAIDKKTYLGSPGEIRKELDTKNACATCHRGLERVDAATKANFPQMADCLVCHPKIDPPFSCEKCHLDTKVLKPASHTPDYVDSHSSGRLKLDKPSCRICHGVNFQCLGCH
ncbi:MAG: hypothetical protein HY238_15055 [Acidobacteria bacterium]|nr:hypothetical protein [Acidobacteriota bacterium]